MPFLPGEMRVDELPVDLVAETRLFVHVHVTVLDLRAVEIHALPDRIAIVRTMRLDREAGARECRNEMAVQFRRMVRRNHYAMLVGHMRDAQRFGKAGVARRIELDVTYAADGHEIARAKTRQLALAVRKRDRRPAG